MTSLLDEKMYPAAEIAELYHERWELELGYDELKKRMCSSGKRRSDRRGQRGFNRMGDGHCLQFGSARDGFVGTGLEGAVAADQLYDVFANHPRFLTLVGDHDDAWGVAEEAGGDAAGFESVYLATQEGGSVLSTPCENQNERLRPKPWSPTMIDGKNPYLNRIGVN